MARRLDVVSRVCGELRRNARMPYAVLAAEAVRAREGAPCPHQESIQENEIAASDLRLRRDFQVKGTDRPTDPLDHPRINSSETGMLMTIGMRGLGLAMAVLGVALTSEGRAKAGYIPIANASFEEPTYPTYGYGPAAGWTESGSGSVHSVLSSGSRRITYPMAYRRVSPAHYLPVLYTRTSALG